MADIVDRRKYTIDGEEYPELISFIESIRQESPILLSSEVDAKYVRAWFKKNTNAFECSWVECIWFCISGFFTKERESVKRRVDWSMKPISERRKKTKKITKLIRQLQQELQSEDYPLPPKTYDLLDCSEFFFTNKVSFMLTYFCEKNNFKTIYSETIIDTLSKLNDKVLLNDNISNIDKRPQTGDSNKRYFARRVEYGIRNFFYCEDVVLDNRPRELIAALVRLKFPNPDGEPDAEKIKDWLKNSPFK